MFKHTPTPTPIPIRSEVLDVLTSDTNDGFLSRQVGDVNKGVVERGVDVSDAEHELALLDLGAKGNGSLFLGGACFGWL
jgi:hypothetical protein